MAESRDAFMTFCEHHADFNSADSHRATVELFLREALIDDFVEGRTDAETVLDCIEEQGIGADAYVAAVEDNVRYIIDSGRAYQETESGLLLPG